MCVLVYRIDSLLPHKSQIDHIIQEQNMQPSSIQPCISEASLENFRMELNFILNDDNQAGLDEDVCMSITSFDFNDVNHTLARTPSQSTPQQIPEIDDLKLTSATRRCVGCKKFVDVNEFKSKMLLRGVERKSRYNCISCSAKRSASARAWYIRSRATKQVESSPCEPEEELSPLAAICNSLNLHVDLLNYTDLPLDDTPMSRFTHATMVFALATRLDVVQKRWRPVKQKFSTRAADFFREVSILIDLVKRGKLQPWQPFSQWLEPFEAKTCNIWNSKTQLYATGCAGRKLDVFGLICGLCEELGNVANNQLQWARTEMAQACVEMGVLNLETELEKHMKMVTDAVLQDSRDRGCLLLQEVLAENVIGGRKFTKAWMPDTRFSEFG